MKEISIDEAQKILDAHRPKRPPCHCGLEDKIKNRIKELETKYRVVQSLDNDLLRGVHNQAIYEELLDLLGENKE